MARSEAKAKGGLLWPPAGSSVSFCPLLLLRRRRGSLFLLLLLLLLLYYYYYVVYYYYTAGKGSGAAFVACLSWKKTIDRRTSTGKEEKALL